MRGKKVLLLVAALMVMSLTLTACFNCGGTTPSWGTEGMGDVVAIADGMEITEGEVMFALGQAERIIINENIDLFPDAMMAMMFGMPADIDYDTVLENGMTFREAVGEQAVRVAAMYRMYIRYAEQNGINLTTADRDEISDHIELLIENFGGVEELLEMTAVDNVHTLGHLENVLLMFAIMENVVETVVADDARFAEFEEYLQPEDDGDEEIFGAKHILIRFEDRSEEEAEELANSILARARAGEDFDALIAEYGEDPGMLANPQGYTFVAGSMVEAFYEATKELEIGEISGLVRNDHHGGFHIILRVEPSTNPADVMRPPGLEPMTLEQRRAMAIQEKFSAMSEIVEITFLPAFSNIVIGE